MRGLRRTISILGVITLTWLGSVARGESVRTVDDKIVSGTITGFADGELSIQPTSADAAAVKIPLAEIVEITLRPPALKPAPNTKPANGPTPVGPSFANVLGSFFGLSSGPAAEPAADSSGSTEQPDSGDEGESPSDSTPQAVSTPSSPTSATPAAVEPAPAVQVVAAGAGYTAAPVVQPTAAVQPTAVKTASSAAPATATHAKGPLWHIEFGASDHATAAMTTGSPAHIKLSLDGAGAASLELPIDQLREIWSSKEPLVKKARDLKVQRRRTGHRVRRKGRRGQVGRRRHGGHRWR